LIGSHEAMSVAEIVNGESVTAKTNKGQMLHYYVQVSPTNTNVKINIKVNPFQYSSSSNNMKLFSTTNTEIPNYTFIVRASIASPPPEPDILFVNTPITLKKVEPKYTGRQRASYIPPTDVLGNPIEIPTYSFVTESSDLREITVSLDGNANKQSDLTIHGNNPLYIDILMTSTMSLSNTNAENEKDEVTISVEIDDMVGQIIGLAALSALGLSALLGKIIFK
jgi:hypothetical protein